MTPDSTVLQPVLEFLKKEKEFENAGKDDPSNYDKMRFVGYALDIAYDKITIITSDRYKINVGGIPRNSFLIMIPEKYEEYPPHFVLLQVLDASETPLKKEVQMTYFELHKKSMPELDRFTQNELQWGALETNVLGMFYINTKEDNKLEFSHDLVNYVSAHKYRVYSPPKDILEIVSNALIPTINQFSIGRLRSTENKFPINENSFPEVEIKVSTKDLLGARTALFGKTRLGKSNTVKIIVKSIIETTRDKKVGQLIFDIDGEYANDNPQDGSRSIGSMYEESCEIYSFKPKNQRQKQLQMNFYENPEESIQILRDLLQDDRRGSDYIKNFSNTPLVSFDEIRATQDVGEQIRYKRRILMYWAILSKAGFEINIQRLTSLIPFNRENTSGLRFRAELLDAAYNLARQTRPASIDTLPQLITEFEKVELYRRLRQHDPALFLSTSGDDLLEPEDLALLYYLIPKTGTGPSMLASYRKYHSSSGNNSVTEIIDLLDDGKTVIMDLSHAHPSVLTYFSKKLTHAVFLHQQQKFVEDRLGTEEFIQLYFEEAHNLFPKEEDDYLDEIYKRIAKEGAKFHIGMIYSTQSVTTIDPDLLAQTENFFIAHISSQDEVRALVKNNIFFENYERDILRAITVGYLRIMTRSHRFVIPVQIDKFESNELENESERSSGE